jgi:acyl-coenzyme A synthetase/AMP-(fatty) acid ligase
VIGAGEPLNPEVIEQVRKAWGLTIRDGFGQTETTRRSATRPASRSSPARWAARCPATEVVLLDVDDKDGRRRRDLHRPGAPHRRRPDGRLPATSEAPPK